jgi:hypothetical protein
MYTSLYSVIAANVRTGKWSLLYLCCCCCVWHMRSELNMFKKGRCQSYICLYTVYFSQEITMMNSKCVQHSEHFILQWVLLLQQLCFSLIIHSTDIWLYPRMIWSISLSQMWQVDMSAIKQWEPWLRQDCLLLWKHIFR